MTSLFFLLAAAVAGSAAAADPARAAAVPAKEAKAVKPRIFPGLVVDLATKDGWPLKAKYNPAKEDRPSLLLLHGTGGRKEDWYWLAKPLFKRGYGYLAVDLRGHGESRTAPDGKPATWRKFIVNKDYNGIKKYNEYLNMMADVEAGIAYLVAQGVPEERIAVVGADVGSCLAIRYAALHPKVPMVALLSPRMQYQDVTSPNALRAYKDRPIMMMYSEADKNTVSGMSILQYYAKMSVGDQRLTVIVAPTEHGTKMLRGPVIGRLIDWLENPIQPEVSASSATVSESTQTATDSSEDEEDAGEPPAPAPASD